MRYIVFQTESGLFDIFDGSLSRRIFCMIESIAIVKGDSSYCR